MKFLGLDMKGPLKIEKISGGMPTWTSNDKGRLVWDIDNNVFYFGSGTEWSVVKKTNDISVGGDQDGDMYYRDSDVLNRLAKGSANQKLFMNALGTIPEWSSDSIIKTTTFDLTTATGSTSITGVGFKPSSIIALIVNNVDQEWSTGFVDSNLTCSCIYRNYVTEFYMGISLLYFGYIQKSAGIQRFQITSLDSDGFTYSNTKISSPTGNLSLKFICFR